MSTSISTALCLPAREIEALLQGRSIGAVSKAYVYPGQRFGLCADDIGCETASIQAWASCEVCQPLDNFDSLNALSRLIVRPVEDLQQILREKKYIFLTYLRVHLLPKPLEVSVRIQGQFASLSIPTGVSASHPVFNDAVFAQRKKQLENLEPPLHPEMEELQGKITQLAVDNPRAEELEHDIKLFLGWVNCSKQHHFDPDLEWIEKIVDVGNSSDGDGFEKLVRKSLIKLGFSNSLNNHRASLDPNRTGGSAGLDVYCTAPYPLVGECKATKNETVSNEVSAQLIHLGNTHLCTEQFNKSLKVLFVAGNLTSAAEMAAVGNQMNVMRPETLQKLVEQKSKYPGSINLMELETHLKKAPFGEESNNKILRFIEQNEQQIKTRSNLVQAVKLLTRPDRKHWEVGEICTCYNLKFAEDPSQELDKHKVHEFLIELSSPLTGYLGRVEGVTGMETDRFYFLRDLSVD